MLIFGVLVFSAVTFFISFLTGQSKNIDTGKVATVMTLTSWGSLLFGLFIARFLPW